MSSAQPGPGSRVGSYEIAAPLGSGGMGEVYRARDPRLGRDVALKILPPAFSADPDRLRRFQREALAVSASQHPNIVAVFDVGTDGPVSYIAMELVDGKTLRELLRSGPLGTKRMLEIAVGVAAGLAHAHEAGLVHRDVKPENVMVTRDGVVKLLDFGLAKRALSAGARGDEPTLTFATEPGAVLGTVRYMSPEQATGGRVDFRSDQFSFGSVLYEMATGKAAFSGDTNVDTLSAILHADPESIARVNTSVPAPLRWIVERCLEKDPAKRYASTRDLAHDLAALVGHLSEISASGTSFATSPRSRRRRLTVLASAAAALAVLASAYLVLARPRPPAAPSYRQLTFRGDGIAGARFTRDGHTILYSAQSEGGPLQLYMVRTESPQSRLLDARMANILSVSSTDQLAILLGPGYLPSLQTPHLNSTDRDPRLAYGTLATMPLGGGEPHEVLEGVRDADWNPDGQTLAVVRFADGLDQLESPPGKVLERTLDWINRPRFSPDGRWLAYQRMHTLFLVGPDGKPLQTNETSNEIAWMPTGEVVLSEVIEGSTALRARRPDGRTRQLGKLPGDFVLYDVTVDGRLLLGRVFESSEILVSRSAEQGRVLSLFSRSGIVDVSADGGMILFIEEEGSEAAKSDSIMYLRRTDGSPPRRLGPGNPVGLSHDGAWVLCSDDDGFTFVPTGPGSERRVLTGKVAVWGRAGFLGGDDRAFFMGLEKGHGVRVYVTRFDGSAPVAISPEGVRRGIPSGDGRYVAGRAADGGWYMYPATPGEPVRIAGLRPADEPIQWTADGRGLYVRGVDEPNRASGLVSATVFRLDPFSGERQPWKEITPNDALMGGGVGTIRFSADGRTCVYVHRRFAMDLFLADGFR